MRVATPQRFWIAMFFSSRATSLRAAREEQVAALAEPHVDAEVDREPPAQLDRLLHQPDVDLGRPLLAHAAAVAARRALGEVAALDHDDVGRGRGVARWYAIDSPITPPPTITISARSGSGPAPSSVGGQPDLAGDVGAASSSSSSIDRLHYVVARCPRIVVEAMRAGIASRAA